MPIRQTKGKWYWGTQGPFDSKKKAQEVAKAAHSSGYTKKASDPSSPGSREMGRPAPLTATEMRRKVAASGTSSILKYGVQDFGNPQMDALKRGAEKPAGWKRKNAHGPQKDETSMDKLTAFVKFDQQRSTNHPAYPSNYQGKLGPKRIDWRKKKDPNFEKHTRVGTSTDSVYQSSMNTNLVLAKEVWLQKFMDVSRQRVIAYILKEADEEEPKTEEVESEEGESTESEESTPAEETVDKPVTVAGALRWDTSRMGPMPETRIEINDADEAPKGTRLIEGPRGGLYYDGAASDGAEIDDHVYSDEFQSLRNQVRHEFERQDEGGVGSLPQLQAVFNELEMAHMKYLIDEVNKLAPDVVDDYKGHLIPLDADVFAEIGKDIQSRPEWMSRAVDYDTAHTALVEARERIEPMQAKAINTLLKVFGKLAQPQIGSPNIDEDPAYKLDISPDITLMQDDDGLYGHWLEMVTKRSVALKMLREEGVNSTDDLSDAKKRELKERVIDAERISIKGENTGASYLGEVAAGLQNLSFHVSDFKEDTILLNPYVAQGLFSNNTERYLGAVHVLLHEAIHSSKSAIANDDKIEEMMAVLYNKPHPVTGASRSLRSENFGSGGFKDLISYPLDDAPDGLAYEPSDSARILAEHRDTQKYHLMRDEAYTEGMAQLLLNDRFSRSAATKDDAAKMPLPAGDLALGYSEHMPLFCRWLILQNDGSPLKAREYFMKSFHGKHEDTEGAMTQSAADMAHMIAVNSASFEGSTAMDTPELQQLVRNEVERTGDTEDYVINHYRHAFNSVISITSMYGAIDYNYWGTAEKEDDPFSLKDFMRSDTSTGQRNIEDLVTDPPSIRDIKWFLYGERN